MIKTESPLYTGPVYAYRAEVLKIVDGDTIDVSIDVGFDCHLKKRLRLAGVDAWETRGEERELGLEAKAFVEEFFLAADRVVVQTIMDATGKYGRVLAWVWGVSEQTGALRLLNKELIERGHGEAA